MNDAPSTYELSADAGWFLNQQCIKRDDGEYMSGSRDSGQPKVLPPPLHSQFNGQAEAIVEIVVGIALTLFCFCCVVLCVDDGRLD